MNSILIKDLSYTFNVTDNIRKIIIKNLSFSIPVTEKGSITSIIAPFGAGKTTLLKIIAGIEKYNSGSIEVPSSEDKVIPLIPENNSNLPWLNVEENINSWLKFKKKKLLEAELIQILTDVGLNNYNKFYPQNVNSGFQFRIALARTLTLRPKIILIDDSFKEFDLTTRNEIYSLLKKIKDKYRIQFILATTNLIEAAFLSDHLFLMSKNPAQIIYEKNIDERFNDIDDMLNSSSFILLSQEIQNKFREKSGIALIHYSV